MKCIRVIVPWIAMSLAWTIPAKASDNPGCLPDEVTLLDQRILTSATTFDTTWCPYFECQGVAALMEAAIDWTNLRFFARAFSQYSYAGTHVRAWDRFICTGVTGPTSLTVRATLHGLQAGGCSNEQCDLGLFNASLVVDGGSVGPGDLNCRICDRTMERSLVIEPGVPFIVELQLSASAWTRYCCPTEGNVEAVLSFPDLPAGAFLRSCKGYRLGTPTPTRRATWGQVKQIYR
jgi:hypothetical protein